MASCLGGGLCAHELVGKRDRPVDEKTRPSRDHGMAFDDTLDAASRAARERLDRGQVARAARRVRNRSSDGVLARCFERADES